MVNDMIIFFTPYTHSQQRLPQIGSTMEIIIVSRHLDENDSHVLNEIHTIIRPDNYFFDFLNIIRPDKKQKLNYFIGINTYMSKLFLLFRFIFKSKMFCL